MIDYPMEDTEKLSYEDCILLLLFLLKFYFYFTCMSVVSACLHVHFMPEDNV